MQRIRKTRLALLAFTALAGGTAITQRVGAQDDAPDEGPGWTGLTDPAGIIAARQALMLAIEDLMLPIDTYTVDPSEEPAVISANAVVIAAMLQATPHLFPPTTDLYDPDAAYPETLALPRIWQGFDTFDAMAASSVATALRLSEAREPDALRDAAVELRATCDACHALHLRPYVPSTVSEEDKNFDFDALFGE